MQSARNLDSTKRSVHWVSIRFRGAQEDICTEFEFQSMGMTNLNKGVDPPVNLGAAFSRRTE